MLELQLKLELEVAIGIAIVCQNAARLLSIRQLAPHYTHIVAQEALCATPKNCSALASAGGCLQASKQPPSHLSLGEAGAGLTLANTFSTKLRRQRLCLADRARPLFVKAALNDDCVMRTSQLPGESNLASSWPK